ncbi:MAG TPA: solute carrier family 23 protein [Burkholderiaceae bacterium]
MLIAIALFAPLGRLANAIPAAVVGGTAMIVFAIIGTMGIDMLRRVDLRRHANLFILSAALTMGLLPIVVPGLYSKFPPNLQILLGNGLAMGVLMAVPTNILFHHVGGRNDPRTNSTLSRRPTLPAKPVAPRRKLLGPRHDRLHSNGAISVSAISCTSSSLPKSWGLRDAE